MAIFSSYELLTPPNDYFNEEQVVEESQSEEDSQLDYVLNNRDNANRILSSINILPTPGLNSKSIQKKTSISFTNNAEFVQQMYPIVVKELSKIGKENYASIVIAQMCYESAWGKSQSGKNNFAGLKATAQENGTVKNTSEYVNGKKQKTSAKFKDFNSIEDFVKEYINKLNTKFHAFDGGDYVKNIKQHGYFTAPESQYKSNIVAIKNKVEQYLS